MRSTFEGLFYSFRRTKRAWRHAKRRQKLALLMAVVLVGTFGALYAWIFAGLPSVDRLQSDVTLPTTIIYDRQGRLLYQITDQTRGLNRTVALDELAPCMVQATLATEDANFYRHPGVDLQGILRALWINVRGGEVVAGGSTITQQVVRNLFLDPAQRQERTLRRKLREGVLALELTYRYSRDDILALYLNQTYYGNMAYGVEAAAWAYFGKSARDLTLAECAMLAGLPQAPAAYSPLTNPQAAKARQRVVLDLMVKQGYVSAEEADQAYTEPLSYAATPFPIHAPHFVAAVWTQLQRDYPEALRAGGLEVITTLDLDWQETGEEIVRRQIDALNYPPPGEPAHNAHNAALVALDPHTGHILAMVGSPDYFGESIQGAVNAALAPRQPGSALKPLTYTAAFDPTQPDPWTPATMVLDVRTSFVTRRLESYTPANFGLVEHGPVLLREALASSYNIPAVVTLEHVGVDALIRLATRLGITTLDDSTRYDLALTLGGGEVRLLDLVAAYGAFANGGYRVDPVYILEVRDRDGNVLYQWEPPAQRERVLDPRVAFLITDILSDNEARTPSFGPGSTLNIGRPAAAKTGTTNDFRDNWTVGYTPNLVTGVWVGNADNTPMVKVSGISGAGPIWHEFMRQVLRGQPELTFTRPDGLVRAEVCATSGLLPTPYCPQTIWEWFIEGTVPTEHDTLYRPFEIDRCADGEQLATADTPPECREERVYLVLPPEARDWAQKYGIPQPPTADAVDAASVSVAQNDTPSARILYPDPYTVFRLSPIVPPETQQIRLRLVTPADTVRVTYWLDGAPLATVTAAPFEHWWTLEVGAHTLYAEVTLRSGDVLTTEAVPFRVNAWDAPE